MSIIDYAPDSLLSLYRIKIVVPISGDVVAELMHRHPVLKKKRKKVKQNKPRTCLAIFHPEI